MTTRFHVGTSGFSYDEWRPAFYPEDLPNRDMLAFYAQRLHAVEVNNTFYRMPKRDTVANWRAQVGDAFTFAVKAPQKLTWTHKLKDCAQPLSVLFDALAPLGDSLGCVFYQVPKFVKKDPAVLRDFLALQPAGTRVAFEFAHASWLEDDAIALLRERDAALVLSDKEDAEPPRLVTTGTWHYLRLRRPGYTDADLAAWRDRVDATGARDCFLFFKHEDSCAGPALAKRFVDLGPPS